MVHLRKLFKLLLPTLHLNTISSISIISSKEGGNMGKEEGMDLDMIVQR